MAASVACMSSFVDHSFNAGETLVGSAFSFFAIAYPKVRPFAVDKRPSVLPYAFGTSAPVYFRTQSKRLLAQLLIISSIITIIIIFYFS